MNLNAQVKNIFNISEILKKLLLRINKLENNSNSGDFIPLSGTEVGNPVTGDIEIEGAKIKSIIDGEGGSSIDFTRPDEGIVLENYNSNGVKQAELVMNGGNVYFNPMNGAESTAIGFFSPFDFSNITTVDLESDKLIYAQRSYVDKANSYSTDETLTGGTWIDGKPIYRKVTEFTDSNVDGLSSLTLDTNYPDLESVSRTQFILNRVSNSDKIYFGNTETEFPIIFRDTASGNLVFHIFDTDFNALDLGQFNFITIILEYTKTTD